MANCFRNPKDGTLDRQYLRTCAIYRLLKHKHIGQAEALQMQNRKWRKGAVHYFRPQPDYLTKTIEIWKNGPLSDMLP